MLKVCKNLLKHNSPPSWVSYLGITPAIPIAQTAQLALSAPTEPVDLDVATELPKAEPEPPIATSHKTLVLNEGKNKINFLVFVFWFLFSG